MFKLFSKLKVRAKLALNAGTEMTKIDQMILILKVIRSIYGFGIVIIVVYTEGGEAINKSSQAFANYKDWEKD